MDMGVDHDDENVHHVLAQECSELFDIMCCQSPSVITSLCKMVPREALPQNQPAHTSSAVASVAAMLEYVKKAPAAECRIFLQTVCMLCENIPMRLESRLISVAGHASSCFYDSVPSAEADSPLTPPSAGQLIKRPRIDHWEQYITEVMGSLLRRWRRLTEQLVKEVQLEKVWVSIRNTNRGRDRPDQTPAPASRASRAQDPDVDYGCMESRLTLETFLQGCAGKVTLLVGQAGSGKTLLMSCLGQQWAERLGPIPSSYLFVLLEFRQLNLLACPLSLPELLFQHYVPPSGGNNAKQAILDYLLSNPEQSCWVLDGYDEFHRKIIAQEEQSEPLDLRKRLPVADLISGLLKRQLLPGSTVLVTCRLRDAVDLDGLADKVGQLLGWDHNDSKEYVENFFSTQDRSVGAKAADLLLSSRHLLAMSSVPGLCSLCCICLEHLLIENKDAESMQMLDKREGKARRNTLETKEKEVQIPAGNKEEEDSGGEGRAQKRVESGKGEDSENIKTDDIKCKTELLSTSGQVPATHSQVYLTVVAAFLSRCHSQGGRDHRPQTKMFPDSGVGALGTLSHYQSELCELSQLAWTGLEESKIIFTEEEVPTSVLELSIKAGLFSQVELRRHDGTLDNAYCFIHLTVQEFLAALKIMTSTDVNDAQLKKRFSLRTRWTTKFDQKTVFTDSLYLFVCGLASPQCTQALVQVAKASGLKGAHSWVQKRQTLVLKLLKGLCHSNTLTGPKLLQLCHYIQESQDHGLAKQLLSVRPTLELRNIWLLPNDIDALAFVVNSGGNNDIGLDFGACSMELECLDALSRCQYIHHLSFRGRKYGDKFAEKLSSILPGFTALKKLEFCGASMSATGAESLASGLQNCPNITEINFSDNNLQDKGIRHIAEIFNKLPSLMSVTVGQNNTSLKAVEHLIEKMSSCLNMQHVHADGMKEVKVTFSQKSDNSHKTEPEPTVSLLNQTWSQLEMKNLAKSLSSVPVLSVLNLSGGQWDEEPLTTLAKFVPKFRITKKLILNDVLSSVEFLVVLTSLLSHCPLVMELHIRLQHPVQISVVFSGGGEKPANEMPKKLCLSCCNLLPADLERVWRSLGTASGLTVLDLSSNRLGNKGLKKLLIALPRLSKIQKINASNNCISMDGVVLLADALCSHNSLMQIYISHGGKDQLTLLFSPEESNGKQKLKTFRMNNSRLLLSDVSKVCRRLVQCHYHLELEFSRCSFVDDAIEKLVRLLPKMLSLQRLNVSNSITSTSDALVLVSCLTDNQRVTSVDLSPQNESFISFDGANENHLSCRLTDFCFDLDHMEELLEILQQSQKLYYLDLSRNQLTDAAVKSLVDSSSKFKISSYLNLSNNRLSQQGVLDVISTLVNCTNVSDVEVSLGEDQKCLIWFSQTGSCEKTLSVRDVSLEHSHLVRLAEMVSSCPSMAKLDFRNNLLPSKWIEDLVKVLNTNPRRYTVSIEECWIRGEDAVRLLCRCLELSHHIETIRIQGSTIHLSLMETASLTSISLVDCAVTGNQLAPMRSIAQYPLLAELDFSCISLGTDGAEFISSLLPSLPNLVSLSVGVKASTVSVVEEISQAVLQSTSIRHLDLSGHVITDAAAQNMTAFLPRLRSLNLSHCVWSPAEGLQLIRTLRHSDSLEELCLNNVPLDEEIQICLAEALKNMKSMRSIKLNESVKAGGRSEPDGVLDLLAGMEGMTQITEIQLGAWRLSGREVQQLSRLLSNWKELRKICLSKNLIGDQSGVDLLGALKSCSHLEELHLSSNHLGDLSAASMALVLPSLTYLAVLDISENRIGHEGSIYLSKALMSLKNLTKFHLTSVGTSELKVVAASLVHCPLIQDVGLGWNNCGDEVALELATVLPFCHKLTLIDLECNSVSVLGVEALLQAARSCPVLQVIRLWKNKVSQGEAQKLSLKGRWLNFSPT